MPLSGRGAHFSPKGVGWAPSLCGGLPYPSSVGLQPWGRAAGEVLTDQIGEEGGLTVPVTHQRPGGTPPQPPVDIVGRASRPPGQAAPTGPAAYEAPRTGGVGIPAAPPANAPGGRFAPPAPPARHLQTADGRFQAATMTPPAGGRPFHPMPPEGTGALRPPQNGNGSIGSGIGQAPSSGLANPPQSPNGPLGYAISRPPSHDPARPVQAPNGSPELFSGYAVDDSSPGPILSRPAWATSDRPVRPSHAAPAFDVSIPPPVVPGRPLPPPMGSRPPAMPRPRRRSPGPHRRLRRRPPPGRREERRISRASPFHPPTGGPGRVWRRCLRPPAAPPATAAPPSPPGGRTPTAHDTASARLSPETRPVGGDRSPSRHSPRRSAPPRTAPSAAWHRSGPTRRARRGAGRLRHLPGPRRTSPPSGCGGR